MRSFFPQNVLDEIWDPIESVSEFPIYFYKTEMHRKYADGMAFSVDSILFAQTYLSKYLGPVVQSIVSLTNSLRGQLVKCYTTL